MRNILIISILIFIFNACYIKQTHLIKVKKIEFDLDVKLDVGTAINKKCDKNAVKEEIAGWSILKKAKSEELIKVKMYLLNSSFCIETERD